MINHIGRLFVCTYFLLIAFMASYIVGPIFAKHIDGSSLSALGLVWMVSAILLLHATRFEMSCVWIGFMGLILDDAGLKALPSSGTWEPSFFAVFGSQAIFMFICDAHIKKMYVNARASNSPALP